MSNERLSYALRTGGLTLPEDGRIAMFVAPGAELPDLSGLPMDQITVISTFAPHAIACAARGIECSAKPQGRFAASILSLPRARDLAETQVSSACACTDGIVVINGAKYDGIEAMAKAVKKRVDMLGLVSKAHGKCLWFDSSDAFADWTRPDMAQNAHGDWTAPGVFSADAPDAASVVLAAALPANLKGAVADLGAGWGWLGREVLKHDGVTALHMVEADSTALDCARRNVTDPRAQFYWDDATTWKPTAALQGVVMNPPFHVGRKADPKLGQAFIANAARILAPNGQLWMVANRHLPYETTLAAHFRDVSEIGGTGAFKVLHGSRPSRGRR